MGAFKAGILKTVTAQLEARRGVAFVRYRMARHPPEAPVHRSTALSRRSLVVAAAAAFAASKARGQGVASEGLQVVVDTRFAPDLAGWGAKLQNLCRGWWPRITDLLAQPGFTPPVQVEIDLVHVEPRTVPAATRGAQIFVDADHVRADPDTGFIAHELVHVAQQYPAARAVWLSEGIADYLRYYVLLPNDPQRAYSPDLGYKVGYQPAAALLDWTVKRYGEDVIRRVNAAMRSGHDGEVELASATGRTPEQLWDAFTAERSTRSPAA